MIPVVFSECLLGGTCRFDAAACTAPAVCRLAKKVTACAVCPEVLGGLKTPRLPAERVGERVILQDGSDVTAEFVDGAHKALESARMVDARLAIFKAKSPSCGSDYVFDGTFTGRLVPGEGFACELFRRSGIAVFNEAIVADHEVRPGRPFALLVHRDFEKIIDFVRVHNDCVPSMVERKDSARYAKNAAVPVVGMFETVPVVVYGVDGRYCHEMVDACLQHAYQRGARQAIVCSADVSMAFGIDVFEITGFSTYRRDTYLFTVLREIVRTEGIEIPVNRCGYARHCDKIPCPTFECFTIFLQRLFYLLSCDLA